MSIQNPSDLLDKQSWCDLGLQYESRFVERVAPYLGLTAQINPQKAADKYAYDLIVNGKAADLKFQGDAFFRAKELYGIEIDNAITFNLKDYQRYKKLYPGLVIYFWVQRLNRNSLTLGRRTYHSTPLRGVWRAYFPDMAEAIESGKIPLHTYEYRKDDTKGNAKSSYVFDLSDFECLTAACALPKRAIIGPHWHS